MSYAVKSELRARIGASIFDEIYGPLPVETPEGDLASAAAEIDGAVAYRYALPVSGAASLALLKDWNLTLAEERAFARPVGGDFSEKIKTRVAQVRQYLAMIRTDDFRLPDAVENGSGSGGVTLVQRDEPVFGRNNMGGF